MILPEENTRRFVFNYVDLLRCTAALKGFIPEDEPVDQFSERGVHMLSRAQIALMEDRSVLDESLEDASAAGKEEFSLSTLRAVRQAYIAPLRVMRDTPQYTICYDDLRNEFLHLKSLNTPLSEDVRSPYTIAIAIVMPFEGEVIHSGLVTVQPQIPALDASAITKLEKDYAASLRAGRIVKPWGPGTGRINERDLPAPVRKAVLSNAALLHSEFVAAFEHLTTISPDVETYLELCLESILIMRHRSWQQMRTLFTTGKPVAHHELLFTLDRMEDDIFSLAVVEQNKRFVKRLQRRTHADTRPDSPVPKAPVTLAERLNAAAPFNVTGTRELTQVLREKGSPITLKSVLCVVEVIEGPEEVGIACKLDGKQDDEVFMVPLTYLIFPRSSPFFTEVAQWQRKRHKVIERLNRV